MKTSFVLLIAALSVAAQAQTASPDRWGAWPPGKAPGVQARQESAALALRLQARQRLNDDRRATQHARNRNRCEAALRVAESCGKYAGMFRCNDKGFQSIPEADRIKAPVLDRAGTYRMERCALDMARKNAAVPDKTGKTLDPEK
jgi:hypothetical protein